MNTYKLKYLLIISVFLIATLLLPNISKAQITVTQPNYFWEIWPRGWTIPIKWVSNNTTYDRVSIEYSTDNQTTWKPIPTAQCIPNTNEFAWTIPISEDESDMCWVCVYLYKSNDNCSFIHGSDCSDARFIIADAPTCYYSIDAFNVYCDPALVPPDCITGITYDITNHSSLNLIFCLGLSMRDPDLIEYDYPDCDSCYAFDPGETRLVTRCFCIPSGVLQGLWDVRFSVWSIAFDSNRAGPRLCDSGWQNGVCLVPVKKYSWGRIKEIYKD